MANPAELLYSVFLTWNERSKTSVAASSTRKDSNSMETHRQAVKYLNEIEEILTLMKSAGKRVDSAIRMFPTWVKAVFLYPESWRTGDPGVSGHAMDVLYSLLDPMDEFVPALNADRFDELSKYLDRVREALNEDKDLNPTVRASVLASVENLKTMLDNHKVAGDYRIEQALKALLGNLALITAQSKRRNIWTVILNAFFIPYAVNQLSSLSLGAITDTLGLES